MRPVVHAVAALGLGVVTYQATKSWQLAIALAGTELFIDIDHAIEHCLWSEKRFSVRTFLENYSAYKLPRMFFIFHSYEFIALLVILAVYFANAFLWAVVFGVAAHILMDEVGNRLANIRCRLSPGFYFFSYRLLCGFRTESLISLK